MIASVNTNLIWTADKEVKNDCVFYEEKAMKVPYDDDIICQECYYDMETCPKDCKLYKRGK